jgi:hypothetical protein
MPRPLYSIGDVVLEHGFMGRVAAIFGSFDDAVACGFASEEWWACRQSWVPPILSTRSQPYYAFAHTSGSEGVVPPGMRLVSEDQVIPEVDILPALSSMHEVFNA